jgi:hypothetical protein
MPMVFLLFFPPQNYRNPSLCGGKAQGLFRIVHFPENGTSFSTAPTSMTRSPFPGDKPVVSTSRTT